MQLDKVNKTSELTQISEVKKLIKAITQALQPPDPLHYMVNLERAAASEWILTTSEVQQLLGVKPRVSSGDHALIHGYWAFTKSAKVGN